jgi:hypothetical protein
MKQEKITIFYFLVISSVLKDFVITYLRSLQKIVCILLKILKFSPFKRICHTSKEGY